MLIISRNKGEWFVVDGHIRIQIAEVRGDRVKVAIDAPRSVRVEREEQYDARRAYQEPKR